MCGHLLMQYVFTRVEVKLACEFFLLFFCLFACDFECRLLERHFFSVVYCS